MKKRVISLVLAMAMTFSIAACGSKNDSVESTEAEEAVTTESTEESDSYVAACREFMDLNMDDYVTLCDYSKIDVTITGDYEVEMQDAYDYMESVFEEYGPFYREDDTKDTVEEDSIVNVDYTGYLDGEAFDGGSATDQNLDVANNSMASGTTSFIDGFTSGLVGAKVGDTVESQVTFPDDYSNEDLAGKETTFKFTVNAVMKELPFEEIDDQFAKEQFGDDIDTVDKMYDYLLENLQASADQSKENDSITAIQDWLEENCQVEVPEEFLDARIKDFEHSFVEYYCGGDDSQLESYISTYYGTTVEEQEASWRETNENSLKVQFICQAIADKEGITYTDDDYNTWVASVASNNGCADEEALYELYGFGDATYGEYYCKSIYLYDTVLDELYNNNTTVTVEAPADTEEVSETETEED